MKISLAQRIKFAVNAFFLRPTKICFPYEYHCDLRKDIGRIECDNIRRISNCQEEGKVALKNPSIEIIINEAEHWYHVCKKCELIYTGSMDGESFE